MIVEFRDRVAQLHDLSLPPLLLALPGLVHLDLHGCGLSGELPDTVLEMHQLRHLDLACNCLNLCRGCCRRSDSAGACFASSCEGQYEWERKLRRSLPLLRYLDLAHQSVRLQHRDETACAPPAATEEGPAEESNWVDTHAHCLSLCTSGDHGLVLGPGRGFSCIEGMKRSTTATTMASAATSSGTLQAECEPRPEQWQWPWQWQEQEADSVSESDRAPSSGKDVPVGSDATYF